MSGNSKTPVVQQDYEPCMSCGGKIVDDEPSYIPLGDDSVLEIIDQRCTCCGASIVGKYQRTREIKNKEAHDRLQNLLKEIMHS